MSIGISSGNMTNATMPNKTSGINMSGEP